MDDKTVNNGVQLEDRLQGRSCIGYFRMEDTLIRQAPDVIMALMGKMIIVKAEHLYYTGKFEYQALSPLFRMLKSGETIPHYEILVTVNPVTRVPYFTVKEAKKDWDSRVNVSFEKNSMPFDEWFSKLKAYAKYKYNFIDESLETFDAKAFKAYYDDGETPEYALDEDMKNA
jgi:hypothetical protein